MITVLIASITAAVLHIIAVYMSELSPISSAVSELHSSQAFIHTVVLLLCATAQWVWPVHLLRLRSAWLASFVFYLARLNALLIAALIVVFHSASTALHTAMLSVIASLVSICMAGSCFLWWQARSQIGKFSESSPVSVMSTVSGVHLFSFILMTVLVIVGLALDVRYVGAYQRTVGSVFLLWLLITSCLNRISQNASRLS